MVEIDPLILVAAGSAVFGFATIAICLGKSSTSTVSKVKSSTIPASKPIKKKSKSVSKSSKTSKRSSVEVNVPAEESEIIEETGETSINSLPPTEKEQVSEHLTKISDKNYPKEIVNEEETVNEESRKNKKPKESPEQKVSYS